MRKYEIIGRLNVRKIQKYKKRLWNMDVILTYERRKHIKCDHDCLFNEIISGLKVTIEEPDLIYESRVYKQTVYYVRKIGNRCQNVVIKLAVRHKDKKQIKNSIITSWIASNKYMEKFAKKNDLVYTKDSEK